MKGHVLPYFSYTGCIWQLDTWRSFTYFFRKLIWLVIGYFSTFILHDFPFKWKLAGTCRYLQVIPLIWLRVGTVHVWAQLRGKRRSARKIWSCCDFSDMSVMLL